MLFQCVNKLLLLGGSLLASAQELLPPLPSPSSNLTGADTFDLSLTKNKIYIDWTFSLVVDSDGLSSIPTTAMEYAEVFRDDLARLTSQEWELHDYGMVVSPKTPGIHLSGLPSTNSSIYYPEHGLVSNDTITYENGVPTREGYEIVVYSKDAVLIRGSGARGMFWGTRTLLQMIMNSPRAPPVKATHLSAGYRAVDAPAYPTRGFMLDAGRKWYSPKFLKDMCSYASFFKMNEFHYHLSDNYPLNRGDNSSWQDVYSHFSLLPEKDVELRGMLHGRENETLSREDFDDLQMHCAKRGITVIPEIEAPGHCLYLTKWKPELSLPKRDLLNLSHPDTIPTVKRIWAEFLPWFKTKEVHIGADEYDEKLADDYIDFVNEMSSWVNKTSGKKIRIWGTHEPSEDRTISKDVIIQHWQYGQSDPVQLLKDGYEVINSEDWWAYTSLKNDHDPIFPAHYPQFFNETRLLNFADRPGWQWTPADFNPFNATNTTDITMKAAPGAKGAIMAAWNDNGPDATTQLEAYYSMRRGIALTAARAWSGKRGPEVVASEVSSSIDFYSPFVPGQNLDRILRRANTTSVPTGSASSDRGPLVRWTRGDDWKLELGSKGMNYSLSLTVDGPFLITGADNTLRLDKTEKGHTLVFEADGYEYPLRKVAEKDALQVDPGHPGRIWVNVSTSSHAVIDDISVPVKIDILTDVQRGSVVWLNGELVGRFEVYIYGGRNIRFSWSQLAFVAPLNEIEGGALAGLVLEDGWKVPVPGQGFNGTQTERINNDSPGMGLSVVAAVGAVLMQVLFL